MSELTIPRGTLEVARQLLSAAIADARTALVKGSRSASQRRRAKAIADALEPMADELAAYFMAMADRIVPVTKAVKLFDPDSIDWQAEEEQLREVIGRWYVTLGSEAYDAASAELGVEVPWDISQPGVKRILAGLASRVSGITDISREKVRRLVATAVDRGYSLDQLVRGVEEDGFAGLRALVEGWASTATGTAGTRAALIAVTETATAYNLSGVAAYADSGVVNMVEVFDGTVDDICAEAVATSPWTLEQANDDPLGHPNCQRAFGPVTS